MMTETERGRLPPGTPSVLITQLRYFPFISGLRNGLAIHSNMLTIFEPDFCHWVLIRTVAGR